MRIGVFGTGMVGHAIAAKLVALGHDVMMGSRTANHPKASAWARDAGPRGSAGTFALLDVERSIDEADPEAYAGVLVPGGAKSPALLAQSDTVLSFLREINGMHKLVAPICRGTLLVASSGIVKDRHVTGFHLGKQYPDLVVQPIVEKFGGIWRDDEPVVVDGNLISSRHPDDIAHFSGAIRDWLLSRTNRQQTQGESTRPESA